jgi:hypothetical protein
MSIFLPALFFLLLLPVCQAAARAGEAVRWAAVTARRARRDSRRRRRQYRYFCERERELESLHRGMFAKEISLTQQGRDLVSCHAGKLVSW